MEIRIELPETFLEVMRGAIKTNRPKFFRDGIELEKGAVLTARRIEKKRTIYEKFCQLWSSYPDLFLDIIKPLTSKFNLYFYQRIFLRVCLRHGRVLTIAPRALITSAL